MAGVNNGGPGARLQNFGVMAGMMREVLNSFLMNVDDMLPAQVISYDRATNLAEVQPMIFVIKTNNQIQKRAPIASVPVLQIGGGNFMLNFNLNKGDLGFIKANDRDISLFMKSFTSSVPNTYRKHKFSDAIFIPAPMKGMTINSEDEANVVLSTTDGKQRVAIWPDRVKLTSGSGPHPSSITITDGNIILDSALLTIKGDVIGDGSSGTGSFTFDGTIHATGDVTAATISLEEHVHSGVQTGGSHTGIPVP